MLNRTQTEEQLKYIDDKISRATYEGNEQALKKLQMEQADLLRAWQEGIEF